MLVRLILIAAILAGVATLSMAVVAKRRKLSVGLFVFSITLAVSAFALLFASGVTTPHHSQRVQADQTDDT
jgi:hypothetical protein